MNDRKLLPIGGNKLPTRLSYLVWWLKFNENCIEVCRLKQLDWLERVFCPPFFCHRIIINMAYRRN